MRVADLASGQSAAFGVRRHSGGGPLRAPLLDRKQRRRHHVGPRARFTTLDGQYLEFEEDVMLLAEGEKLTVRYRPENPVRSATVMGPGGAWSPLFGQAFGILITGMFSLLGLLFLWLSLTQ
ncbi:DUF3592 domain-containing protein [Streptomyces sp. NPDC006703]|uniref:DUF3592 domain-containing protein n=1 Tax=Streptomyces sp. NPDC006703 TaxID=3364759 RepID=UPI0036C39D62